MRIASSRPSPGARPRVFALAAGLALTTALAGCAADYDEDFSTLSYDGTASHGSSPRLQRASYSTDASQPAGQGAIPLPNQALLTPPKAPECGARDRPQQAAQSQQTIVGSEGQKASAASGTATVSSAETARPAQAAANSQPSELEERIALEYERACYKQAEARIRARLLRLQVSVNETIRAVKRRQELSP
jgi:hypothetical protein